MEKRNMKMLKIGMIEILLFAGILASLILAVLVGSVDITAKDVYSIIINKIFNIPISESITAAQRDIVWELRLPRLVMAVLVGAGLSLSGTVMQAIVKNSLADPYILGISSGASLGATLGIVLNVGKGLSTNFISITAFIGALGTSFLVLLVSSAKGRANSVKLLLAGLAIASLSSALTSFIIWMSNSPSEAAQRVSFWLMGSLEPAKWSHISFITPIVIGIYLFFVTQYRTLNLMLLGDDVAITLGKDLYWYRIIYLVLISALVGTIVSICGIIGFVGLIIPHIIRSIFGTDHKILITLVVLFSSIFMIWMDVISRIIRKGSQLPIGVIISLIGAPLFIYLLVSKTYGFGEK